MDLKNKKKLEVLSQNDLNKIKGGDSIIITDLDQL